MSKEYFAVWMDERDVAMGVITGPFSTYEQVSLACEALQPLFKAGHRVCPVGGDTLTSWALMRYANSAIIRY